MHFFDGSDPYEPSELQSRNALETDARDLLAARDSLKHLLETNPFDTCPPTGLTSFFAIGNMRDYQPAALVGNRGKEDVNLTDHMATHVATFSPSPRKRPPGSVDVQPFF